MSVRTRPIVTALVAALLAGSVPVVPPAATAPVAAPAFAAVWNRVDLLVEQQVADGRGYTWGPALPDAPATEIYDGVPRPVAYFDKARMELARPDATAGDLFAVTTGLLVREMIIGQRQDGDAIFTPLTPSLIAVAGDPNDRDGNPVAPTYASFQALAGSDGGRPATPGQLIVDGIDRAGQVRAVTPPEERRVTGYDPVTRHNVADVFTTYADQVGPIWGDDGPAVGPVFFGNPTYVLGRPIVEPYWTRAVVAGTERDVLVQMFERRVLTYTPANPPAGRVEMGNVGQHYLRWRYAAPEPPPVTPGLAVLSDLYRLPRVGGYTRTWMASSAEPIGQNIDYGTYLYTEPGRYIIFDGTGPGAVTRLWMTGFPGVRALGPIGNLQFFFDDEPTPRVDVPLEVFFAGQQPPFVPPLVLGPADSSGGAVSYVPVPFARRLKIATTRPPAYFQINAQALSGTQPVHSFTGREDLSDLVRILSNPGDDPKPAPPDRRWLTGEALLPPGGQILLGGVLPGPALVSALRLSADMRRDDPYRRLALRLQFDGRAVDRDVPLDFFFGSGLGEQLVRGLMLGIDPSDHSAYCYFPMPFHRQARITLINTGFQPATVRWEIALDPDPAGRLVTPDTGYFRVTYNQEREPRYGDDYVILRAGGRGRYVGTVLSFDSDERAIEGDERVYVDGSHTPQFHGTGVEDYVNAAWAYQQGAFSQPLSGSVGITRRTVPPKRPRDGVRAQPDEGDTYITTAGYRFLLGDAMTFASGIVVGVEHGALGRNKPAEDEVYASAAFWYSLDQPALHQTDVLYIGDPGSERAHAYQPLGPVTDTPLTSRYPGGPSDPAITEMSRRTTGSRFHLALDPNNAGVVLRRQFDAADINQQADVLVDGVLVGRWHTPGSNRERRWRDEDFVIPATLTRGKPMIEVTLVAVVQPSLWSETAYTAYSLRPGLSYVPDGAPLPRAP